MPAATALTYVFARQLFSKVLDFQVLEDDCFCRSNVSMDSVVSAVFDFLKTLFYFQYFRSNSLRQLVFASINTTKNIFLLPGVHSMLSEILQLNHLCMSLYLNTAWPALRVLDLNAVCTVVVIRGLLYISSRRSVYLSRSTPPTGVCRGIYYNNAFLVLQLAQFHILRTYIIKYTLSFLRNDAPYKP